MHSWIFFLSSFGFGLFSSAQGTSSAVPEPFTVHKASEINEHSQHLVEKARTLPEGIATETWQKFGNSFMMLAARVKQGGAEVHVQTADYFIVLQGHATELVGGTVVDGKESSPGEIRGPAITGGEKREMAPGDVVHISANTPHQTLMSGEPFVYLVVKVHE